MTTMQGQARKPRHLNAHAPVLASGEDRYYFAGTWVDLDQHRRPKNIPALPRWATPDGWRQGLRPAAKAQGATPSETPRAKIRPAHDSVQNSRPKGDPELVRQIQATAEALGKRTYRGFLKALARVWDPRQIDDPAVLQKVLTHMQAAQRGLTRLDAALDKIGPGSPVPILDSLGLRCGKVRSRYVAKDRAGDGG